MLSQNTSAPEENQGGSFLKEKKKFFFSISEQRKPFYILPSLSHGGRTAD